jgi:hypothetical protein
MKKADRRPPAKKPKDIRKVIKAMRKLRRGQTLGPGLTLRGLIEEGRRY